MTSKTDKKTRPRKKVTTFKCNYCEKVKPLEEMIVVTRYFPPVVICLECEKKIR